MTDHYGMTKKQHECLCFIEAFVDRFGYSPSYQEIAGHLCLASKSGVHRLVMALRKRGLVRMIPDRARSIVVVKDDGQQDAA